MANMQMVDVPIPNSKAGLYVYLNSLLVGRPMVDDHNLLNFLHNRYHGDIETTCMDLIVSSFDVLTNAIFRNDNAQATFILRSFLINNVPLLVATLASTAFPPISAEMCITEALSHVDTNAFPTFSSMFDDTSAGNIFSDSVRQDFCFACCLQGLIMAESIERLLGEIPMQSLPTGGRYEKDIILQGMLAEPEKISAFIDELENMDGNVGAVASAVAGVIQNLCENKDTSTLRSLCAHLARKPSSLDALLLFEKAPTILRPICTLLDNWHHDEDQNEYQPVYSEFGSILLLLLCFVNRYNLDISHLGLTPSTTSNNFISNLLIRGAITLSLESPVIEGKGHAQIDGWLKGLFNTEAGSGLGDEPMANCPPQDFYLLVPTLIQQVTLAYQQGYLSSEVLKNGLEYLLDTFLLPSLVGALAWLSSHIWSISKESYTQSNGTTPTQSHPITRLLQVLSLLLIPENISGDAAAMHTTVLSLIAPSLTAALSRLQTLKPANTQIAPLQRVLSQHLNTAYRTGAAEHTELENWCAPSNGGLLGSVRRTCQTLANWSMEAQTLHAQTGGLGAGGSGVPGYSHKQMLVAIKMLGARRVLDSLLEDVDASQEGLWLDLLACFVIGPMQHEPDHLASQPRVNMDTGMMESQGQVAQGKTTLREALNEFATEDISDIMTKDAVKANRILGLLERVNELSVNNITVDSLTADALGHPSMGHDEAAAQILGDNIMADVHIPDLGAGGMTGFEGMDFEEGGRFDFA